MSKRARKAWKGRKGTRGLLIKGILERKPSVALKYLAPKLKELLHDRSGIYALYKGDDLYYVGLGTRLHSRLRRHLRDRLSGKWDSFSVFVIRKIKYLKDLETLILRMVPKVKGIEVKSRIPHDRALEREYRRLVREHSKEMEEDLLHSR